jgi:two-component system, OmpR family, response regulator
MMEQGSLETPTSALELLKHNKVDVIFSDVQMPEMDGFQFAEAVRKLGHKVPIVFVTVMSDFQTRAKSLMSGGQDLMGKPFTHLEVGLKALTWLLKTRTGEK